MVDTLAFMNGLKPGDKCYFLYEGYEEELVITRGIRRRGDWGGDVYHQVKFKRPHLKQEYYMDEVGEYVALQMSAKHGKIHMDWRKWRLERSPV
jgi:hypothetical protein